MERVTKEYLMDLVKTQYVLIVEGMKVYKKNLEENMEIIKHLEMLEILPQFAYNEEHKILDKKISSANYKLDKYMIAKDLIGKLYYKGYDEKLVEVEVEKALERINYTYTVNKNKIEVQTYGIYDKMFDSVSDYKLKDKIECIIKIFRLNVDIEEMRKIKFEVGTTQLNDKYIVKFFKNGKIQVVEK